MSCGTTHMFGYLAQQRTLPPIATDEGLNPALQEAGQPPLFYAATAGAARLLGLELSAPQLSRNPYWGYPSHGTVNDNKNRFVHRPGEWQKSPLRALLILRLFSLGLGAGAVVSAYGLARAVRAASNGRSRGRGFRRNRAPVSLHRQQCEQRRVDHCVDWRDALGISRGLA